MAASDGKKKTERHVPATARPLREPMLHPSAGAVNTAPAYRWRLGKEPASSTPEAVAAAVDRRDAIELRYLEAEARWAYALERYKEARQNPGKLAVRRARYELTVADTALWRAHVRLLDAHQRLRLALSSRERSL